MAKKLWHIEHWILHENTNQFEKIDEVTVDTKKHGMMKHRIEKHFNVVKNISSGIINIENFTGSSNDAIQLENFIINGYVPEKVLSSIYSVNITGEYWDSKVYIFLSPQAMTIEEWKITFKEISKRRIDIQEMPLHERFNLPKEEQDAYGFGFVTHAIFELKKKNIVEIPCLTNNFV